MMSKWNNLSMSWGHSSASNIEHALSQDGGGTLRAKHGDLAANTTYWRAARLNDSDLDAYLNGAFAANDTVGTLSGSGNTTLTIGEVWIGTNFTRLTAEMRISNVFRSANFILTHYNNQSDPTVFWTTGALEAAGPDPATISREPADIVAGEQTDIVVHVRVDSVDGEPA